MTQRTTRASSPGTIALGIPAGALCGGLVMWVLVWLVYLVGVSSPWAVYRWYGLDKSAYGALFGALIGPGCAAVRAKPWKAAALGLAVATLIYCGFFMVIWAGGAFRTLADVVRGAATAIPGVAAAGAAIGWGIARVVRAVERGWPLTALQQRRVALMTAGVIALGLVAWRWDAYRQGATARDTCERAARASLEQHTKCRPERREWRHPSPYRCAERPGAARSTS